MPFKIKVTLDDGTVQVFDYPTQDDIDKAIEKLKPADQKDEEKVIQWPKQ